MRSPRIAPEIIINKAGGAGSSGYPWGSGAIKVGTTENRRLGYKLYKDLI